MFDETAPDPMPADYDGEIPTDSSPNGAMPEDPEVELSQDPEDIYIDDFEEDEDAE